MTTKPTDGQRRLLGQLLDEYDRGDFNARCRERYVTDDLSYTEAQAAISYLLAGTRVARPSRDREPIPDGHYALGTVDKHRRYKVRNGRKPGVIFLDEIGGRGEKIPVTSKGEAKRVIDAIAANWQAAGALYGQVSRTCAKGGCGRPLHDPPSVITGYGPDCRETLGIAEPSKDAVAAWIAAEKESTTSAA